MVKKNNIWFEFHANTREEVDESSSSGVRTTQNKNTQNIHHNSDNLRLILVNSGLTWETYLPWSKSI